MLDLRLARALCAVTIGAALGASGAAFQALTRNPLGSPDIIGLTSGAATGALLQILIIGGTALAIAGGALVGGLATAVIVYALAVGQGSGRLPADPGRHRAATRCSGRSTRTC